MVVTSPAVTISTECPAYKLTMMHSSTGLDIVDKADLYDAITPEAVKVSQNTHIMEPPCSFLFLLFLAFLLICSLQISAREIPTTETTFVQEPEANYYIKKDPVKIVCKVRNADDIVFECNDIQIPPTSEENVDASPDYPDVSEARLTIKKDDIVNFEKTKPGEQFWCRCVALDVDGQVIAESRKGMISLAYLQSKFEVHPSNTVIFEGETAEMVCGAPKGNPKPEIIWRKNLRRLNPSLYSHLRISESGSLIISNATIADAANYQCVVTNSAGRHESKNATLSIIDTLDSRSMMELNQAEEDSQGEYGKARHPRQSANSCLILSQRRAIMLLLADMLHWTVELLELI
ncbi:Netrin receptor unc5a [Bulinus truncatus]|nr:Netrin receptor unc5a [Bulinus truncatus]